MAKDYALNRYAFGRPIGSFQAIKHKLADMYVYNELARSNAYYGAWALSTNARELPLAAAAARVAATAGLRLRGQGKHPDPWRHRLHLGSRLPLYYKRSRDLGLALGPQRAWKDKLVTELELNVQRGVRNRIMDFEDSPEEAEFRSEVRSWLEANAPSEKRRRGRSAERARRRASGWQPPARWQAKKAKAGYARITWPKEWAAIGGTPMQQVIFNQEEGEVRRRRQQSVRHRARHVHPDPDGLRRRRTRTRAT